MIVGFGDARTEDLYHGRMTARVRRWSPDIQKAALRKLDQLQAATRLEDLSVLPGNRLEHLHGEWEGFLSIRVNDQWRVVSRWSEDEASDIRVTDYH